jgi:hypothetical protein
MHQPRRRRSVVRGAGFGDAGRCIEKVNRLVSDEMHYRAVANVDTAGQSGEQMCFTRGASQNRVRTQVFGELDPGGDTTVGQSQVFRPNATNQIA